VTRVDVSNNGADDKAFVALAAAIEKLAHGLVRLDVSNNAVSVSASCLR
jgi:hypothetical protein